MEREGGYGGARGRLVVLLYGYSPRGETDLPVSSCTSRWGLHSIRNCFGQAIDAGGMGGAARSWPFTFTPYYVRRPTWCGRPTVILCEPMQAFVLAGWRPDTEECEPYHQDLSLFCVWLQYLQSFERYIEANTLLVRAPITTLRSSSLLHLPSTSHLPLSRLNRVPYEHAVPGA
jgi:hypothetical protein